MDPLLRQQIEELREAGDTAQATILEVLVQVREQTTKTNGRVTALEAKVSSMPPGCPGKCDAISPQVSALAARLDALEKPAQTIGVLWKTAGAAAGHAIVILGLVFAFMATPVGERFFERKEVALEAAVAKAVEEQLAKAPPQKRP